MNARTCKSDDCEQNHCPKCGGHTMGWLDTFQKCQSCELEEEHKELLAKSPSSTIYCEIDLDGQRVFARSKFGGQLVAEMVWNRYVNPPEARLTLHTPMYDTSEVSINMSDLNILMDNWNQMVEMIQRRKVA